MGLFYVVITVLLVSQLPECTVAQNKHHHHNKANPLLETACQHNEACVSALLSDPTARSSDLKGLALVALRLASSNASDVSEHLKVLLQNETTAHDAVSECLEHYIDAAEQIEDSVAAVLVDASGDVETWVGVAVTDADMCDAALDGRAEAVLGDKGKAFRRLCGYALGINKLLAKQRRSN